MIVMFLAAGILAGVLGMIGAALLGLGLGLILVAYPVFGMIGFCFTLTLAFTRRGELSAESSLG